MESRGADLGALLGIVKPLSPIERAYMNRPVWEKDWSFEQFERIEKLRISNIQRNVSTQLHRSTQWWEKQEKALPSKIIEFKLFELINMLRNYKAPFKISTNIICNREMLEEAIQKKLYVKNRGARMEHDVKLSKKKK